MDVDAPASASERLAGHASLAAPADTSALAVALAVLDHLVEEFGAEIVNADIRDTDAGVFTVRIAPTRGSNPATVGDDRGSPC